MGNNILDESADSGDDSNDSNPLEENMPPREATKVNLDALIFRQDMEGGEAQGIPKEFSFRHEELIYDSGMTYSVLRKPDF
ncbi:MAG: hypothetical protein ACJ74J_00385, partial [Blastocatellia bacterium]